MGDYYCTLKPVYSCPASKLPAGVKLPPGWTLAWHQAATLEAVRDPNIDVITNIAMTGDGKSLAAYLDSMQGQTRSLGLYPTNELARDQEGQVRRYIEEFQPPGEPRVSRLSGPELEIYAENEGLRKAAALESRSFNSEILLTNPDIFHYLHRGAYLSLNDAPDKLWNRIDKDFNLFIFDEFHTASAPQIAGIINTMLLIRCTNRQKKFLLMSATPNDRLIERLQAAGFRCRIINPLQERKYQFPDSAGRENELKLQNWRQVSRQIALQFIPLEPTAKATETWVKENSNLILRHFQEYPGSKGAIILNSIAAVKRLVPRLLDLLSPHGLVVGENTGLSGKGEKERSLAADLVIGTSTIDVGVDFKINFLIFESADAGNFIQRLGRLGRHDGYERNGEKIAFTNFTAYALVPNFLLERLFLGNHPPLQSGGMYDRPYFHQQISDKYRQINDFEGYYSRWGLVQSCLLDSQLKHITIKKGYASSREEFSTTCQRVFKKSLGKAYGQIKQWNQEWQELSGQKSTSPIVEDAASFRGTSPLQCGLYDLTEAAATDRFKTYDLSGILSNLEIEPITKVEFMRLLEETEKTTGKPIAKGRFNGCLAFMKLRAYREERFNWKFTYAGDLRPLASAWSVQVLTGIQVWQPENYWINEINQLLKKQGLVSYVVRHPVGEVRSRLRLPMHFQIYPMSDRASLHDPTAPYSVAFGQSALLLDTLTHWLKSIGGDIWIS